MSPGADRDALEVQVRYRRSGDVWSAEVAGVDASVVHRDEPDTDTVVQWVRRPDGRRMLVGAQVLFAAARAHHGSLDGALPPRLARLLADAVDDPATGTTGTDATGTDPLLGVEATTLTVGADDLLLTDDRTPVDEPSPAPALTATAAVTAAVCHGLDRLVDAVAGSTPHADPEPTRRLARALGELADTLDGGGGLAAPGAAAAARAAVRGGVPLTAGERNALEDILGDIDHPDRWEAVATDLDDLADRVAGGGGR